MPEYTDRETAVRVFAGEFNEATHEFRESDDERAPVYTLLPSGAKANRFFIVGTLTETEDVGNESEYWRGRVVDPTGTFFVYAGQYEPEAVAVLRSAEPPEYVAVVGKADRYETDDGGVNLSISAESITFVDAETRNRWVAETAQQTLDRIENTEGEFHEKAREVYEQNPSEIGDVVADALGEDEE